MGKVERRKLLLNDFLVVIDVMEEAEEFHVVIEQTISSPPPLTLKHFA